MRDFRSLLAWERAHALVLEVYEFTSIFPKEEVWGLTSQMRRSAASVPTNIAEGCGSDGGLDLARFLQMAMRSASELDYQLLLARDLGFVTAEKCKSVEDDLVVVRKMLNALIRKVRSDASMPRGGRPRLTANS